MDIMEQLEMAMGIGERNANRSFVELAMSAGRQLADRDRPFTSGDLRDLLESKFPTVSTHDDRVLGSVMKKLSKAGLIIPTGRYVKSNRSRNHNRPMREWVGA
jgi:hypothetical protein